MRRILLSGLFLLLPAVAHAQAQGGPDAPKTDAKKPEAEAPKPADPKPAETAKPADPKPAEPAKPAEAPKAAEPKPAEAPKPAEPSAAGPALGVSTNASASAGTSSQGTAATVAEADAAGAAEKAGETSTTPSGTPPSPVTRRGQAVADESAWKFDYHGYLRAPMKIGIGKRLPEDTNGYQVVDSNGDPYETTIHEATIPDGQYLSFQSTSHNMNSWGEAFFSFGNNWAQGVLGIGAYSFTEAGFSDPDSQWGISQGYVLLTPDLGYENVRLWAKAGAIVDKYGQAGRWDAGEYDTYMFGRTHVMGETIHVDYDITPAWTLYFEQGFGTHKPDPNWYSNARYTLLHHEHVGLKQGRDLEIAAHYLMSWSQEEYRNQVSWTDQFQTAGVSADDGAPRNGLPPGHLWVAGIEARAELGPFGYIYGAYSHVGADYALTVSRAIEVLHSSGGGEFDLGIPSNYLDSPRCHSVPNTPPAFTTTPPENWQSLDTDACSDGNGSLNALQLHYEFSLTNFNQQISGGQRFWGRGFDVVAKLYGMAIFAKSDALDTTAAPQTGGISGLRTAAANGELGSYSVTKAKFGADVTIQALPWLSPGLRFDRVMPNSHIGEQSFAILSPRVQFKSQWITHERITLGYSRYIYDQRVCEPRVPQLAPGGTVPDDSMDPLAAYRCVQPPPSPVPYDGFGTSTGKQDAQTRATGVQRPDENVFKVEATMWW
jgi:hypothetical protein